MKYRITNFSIVCKDIEKAIDAYCNVLGHEMTARFTKEGEYDVAYVGIGSDTLLELVGEPFVPAEKEYLGKKGNINCMTLECEDADKAFEELKDKGINIAWEPVTVENIRQFGIFDADGLLVKIYNYTDGKRIKTPDISNHDPNDLTLQHICLLTEDYKRSLKFYKENFGLKEVVHHEHPNPDGSVGGYFFLVDSDYDGKEHLPMFEIIGPPLEPRELVIFKKYGACWDHFCYTAEKARELVEEYVADGTFQKYMETCYAYGMDIGWIKDPNYNDVEIMQPMPGEVIEMMVKDEETPFAFDHTEDETELPPLLLD